MSERSLVPDPYGLVRKVGDLAQVLQGATSRSPYTVPVAQPASHRDQSRKTLIPAVRGLFPEQHLLSFSNQPVEVWWSAPRFTGHVG